ncbi:MAG: SMC-Scp complex subunit ScpB [Promethearchaeota archaeon]
MVEEEREDREEEEGEEGEEEEEGDNLGELVDGGITEDNLANVTGDDAEESNTSGVGANQDVDDGDVDADVVDSGAVGGENLTMGDVADGDVADGDVADGDVADGDVADDMVNGIEDGSDDMDSITIDGGDSAATIHEVDEEEEFLKNQCEAILFVSGKAISAEEISVKIGVSKAKIEKLLEELAFNYLERATSLEIAKLGDKYILQLKAEYTDHVKKFAAGGLIREAVMRTLTIIAAKQPILQSALSKLRSGAGEHIKEMLEIGLVKKVKKGRSFELTTTEKFADMFGLSRDVHKMKEQLKVFLMGKE